MAEDLEQGDRTEQPTERRRREVRERGHVARSVDLNVAVSVLASAGVLYFFGEKLSLAMADVLRSSLSARAWTDIDIGLLAAEFWNLARAVAAALLPVLALAVASAVLVNALQVGFFVTTEPLVPDFDRINPLAGARRLVSLQSTARLLGSLLKLVVCCAIVMGFVTGRLPEFLRTLDADTAAFCRQTGSWLVSLSFQLALALVVLAGLDYGFQLWKFEQDIKMTRQEVRDELRHMEGDPHIRNRRREAHRKLLTARQVQQTKNADVVVISPNEVAVAIKYDAGTMDVPLVLARGEGSLAERIRSAAFENRIPIVEKKLLARALHRAVREGQKIPAELYEAAAGILADVKRHAKKEMKRA
ncbi:MAG: flagellar biosynthesis protein FlhB [Deltaproteobacteria bacterium]